MSSPFWCRMTWWHIEFGWLYLCMLTTASFWWPCDLIHSSRPIIDSPPSCTQASTRAAISLWISSQIQWLAPVQGTWPNQPLFPPQRYNGPHIRILSSCIRKLPSLLSCCIPCWDILCWVHVCYCLFEEMVFDIGPCLSRPCILT